MPVAKIDVEGGRQFMAVTGYVGDIRTILKAEGFYRLRVCIFEQFTVADFSEPLIAFDVTNRDLRVRPGYYSELELQANDPVTAVFDTQNTFSKQENGLVLIYNHRNHEFCSAYLNHLKTEQGKLGAVYGLKETLMFLFGIAVTLLCCVPLFLLSAFHFLFLFVALAASVVIINFGYNLTIKIVKNSAKKLYWQIPTLAALIKERYQVIKVSAEWPNQQPAAAYNPTKQRSI